jgi:hypothetical protein
MPIRTNEATITPISNKLKGMVNRALFITIIHLSNEFLEFSIHLYASPELKKLCLGK